MKVLLAASEVAPIIKLGGLGDVIGALPKSLEKLDVSCDVIVPYFPFAKIDPSRLTKHMTMHVPYKGASHPVAVYKTFLPDSAVDVFLLQNDRHFHDHNKTWKMKNEEELEVFSFFDRAVVEFVKANFNIYDLVHCHDWHTGLITHLLEDELGRERPATLFTIHNLLYQGVGKTEVVRNVGIVPGEHSLIDWDISDGDLNMIQQGVTSADYVNTVSPSYKNEILTPEFGGGLDDVLKAREGHLFGILNGIDYSSLPRNYDIKTYKTEKSIAKALLQKNLHLEHAQAKPLFAFIGRLDPYQKGIDLVYNAVANIVNKGGQFVLLASGNAEWETKFRELADRSDLKHNISLNLAFNSELASQIYAASDFLLVPSRYEPCGLIQLIAMWYGSLPIVRATGGLKDTVEEDKTGFLFEDYNSAALIAAVDKALKVFGTAKMEKMVTNAMNANFSWHKSAQDYKDLYIKVVQFKKENI